jgi:hypothetical protein
MGTRLGKTAIGKQLHVSMRFHSYTACLKSCLVASAELNCQTYTLGCVVGKPAHNFNKGVIVQLGESYMYMP